MNDKTNKLILSLRAHQSDVEIHKHSAYQIVLTDDNPFHTTIEKKKHQNIYGFVIKPQVAHACVGSNSTLTIINIEPYSSLGIRISKKLRNSNFKIFKNKPAVKNYFNFFKRSFSINNLRVLGELKEDEEIKDDRIIKSIEFIENHFRSEKFSINNISKQVYLSPSRLSFLFKQQVGSSISKYLLWTRLRYAIFNMLSNPDKTLTQIALESGFYDSSQMNKYMYQMFGIAPLKLRKKSDLIQFLK
ncbi:MAG: helix-turn-helix transcriptional regulator [Bacteroidetes bacterium]|nr:helix-turn-helix transcriptional regulator [Bacteroidota bacterium]